MINIDTATPAQLEAKLYELAHKCYEADKKYIELDETYQILDDNKKSYFAVLVDNQEAKTTAEKERAALQEPAWGAHMKALQEARGLARQARVERDNLQRLWETARSILSSKNTERRTNT